jgi:hypothetical protein
MHVIKASRSPRALPEPKALPHFWTSISLISYMRVPFLCPSFHPRLDSLQVQIYSMETCKSLSHSYLSWPADPARAAKYPVSAAVLTRATARLRIACDVPGHKPDRGRCSLDANQNRSIELYQTSDIAGCVCRFAIKTWA